jgi:hypothetical protein
MHRDSFVFLIKIISRNITFVSQSWLRIRARVINILINVKIDDPAAVNIKIKVFPDMAPYSLVTAYLRYRRTRCILPTLKI